MGARVNSKNYENIVQVPSASDYVKVATATFGY
jgi:hypothetical protein